MPVPQPTEAAIPQPTSTLPLKERLKLVPPARIIAAVEDSGSLLTLGDLRQYAKYLAAEFEYSGSRAAWQPAGWYTEQIEHCTPEQGELVRTLTIEVCGDISLYRGYTERVLGAGKRSSEGLDAFGLVMILLLLFVGVPLLLASDATDDPAGPLPTHHSAPIARGGVRR